MPRNPLWAQDATLLVCAGACKARCCRAPGYVKLSPREATRMVQLTGGRKLTVFQIPGEQKLTMNFSENGGQCPLLKDDSTCGWYENRPVACSSYPEGPHPSCLVWPA